MSLLIIEISGSNLILNGTSFPIDTITVGDGQQMIFFLNLRGAMVCGVYAFEDVMLLDGTVFTSAADFFTWAHAHITNAGSAGKVAAFTQVTIDDTNVGEADYTILEAIDDLGVERAGVNYYDYTFDPHANTWTVNDRFTMDEIIRFKYNKAA